MNKTIILFTLLVLLIVVSGCSTGDGTTQDTTQPEATLSSEMETITGTVWYRERMLLPPNTTISIYLEDVSRADAPSVVLSKTILEVGQKGPPWSFSLQYNQEEISDRGRYALRARIEAGGRLLFINTEHIPAFGEHTERPAKIMVSRVGG